jgi:recombination protein RecA
MSSATALRVQIEHSLERRFPAALSPSPRTIRETVTTGIPEVDRLLEGGLPVGAISEVTGPVCSGRTSLALAFLAQRTLKDCVCAWVDANDTLDAESAAASGVSLKQLLWVRCRNSAPRGKEQTKPWAQLEQAVRATDLLLQAGGFTALVLDLGNVAPEHAFRIPLATWFRFRQAADRTRCSLLVLGQQPFAQSSAAVVLECAPQRAQSSGNAVLTGFSWQVHHGRQRFAPTLTITRKPPASTWSADSPWQRESRDPQRPTVDRPVLVTGVEECA